MANRVVRSRLVVNEDGKQARIENGSQELYVLSEDGATLTPWMTTASERTHKYIFTASDPRNQARRTSGIFPSAVPTDYSSGAEAWERAAAHLAPTAANGVDFYRYLRTHNRLPRGEELTDEMRRELASVAAGGVLHRLVTHMSTTARLRSQKGFTRLADAFDDYARARRSLHGLYLAQADQWPSRDQFLNQPEAVKWRTAMNKALTAVSHQMLAMLDAGLSLIATMAVPRGSDDKSSSRWHREWITSAAFRPVIGRMICNYMLGIDEPDVSADYLHAVPLADAVSEAEAEALIESLHQPAVSAKDVFVRNNELFTRLAAANVARSRNILSVAYPGLHSAEADGRHPAAVEAMLASYRNAEQAEDGDLARFLWAKSIEAGMAIEGPESTLISEIHAAMEALALYTYFSEDNSAPPVDQSFTMAQDATTAMAAAVSRHRPSDLQNNTRSAVDMLETLVVNMALRIFTSVVANEEAWVDSGFSLRYTNYFTEEDNIIPLEQAAADLLTIVDEEDIGEDLWQMREAARLQMAGKTTSPRGPITVEETLAIADGTLGEDIVELMSTARRVEPLPGSFFSDADEDEFDEDTLNLQTRLYWARMRSLRSALFWSPPIPESAAVSGFFTKNAWTRTMRSNRFERWPAWCSGFCNVTRESIRADIISAPAIVDHRILADFYRNARLNTTLYVLSDVLDSVSAIGVPYSRAYFTRLVARRGRVQRDEEEEEEERRRRRPLAVYNYMNPARPPHILTDIGKTALMLGNRKNVDSIAELEEMTEEFVLANVMFSNLLENTVIFGGENFEPGAERMRISAGTELIPMIYTYTTAEAENAAFQLIMQVQQALTRAESIILAALARVYDNDDRRLVEIGNQLGIAGQKTRISVGKMIAASTNDSDIANFRTIIRRHRPSLM